MGRWVIGLRSVQEGRVTGSESDQINGMIPGLVKNGFDIDSWESSVCENKKDTYMIQYQTG